MQEEITLNFRALNSILQRIEKQLEKSVCINQQIPISSPQVL